MSLHDFEAKAVGLSFKKNMFKYGYVQNVSDMYFVQEYVHFSEGFLFRLQIKMTATTIRSRATIPAAITATIIIILTPAVFKRPIPCTSISQGTPGPTVLLAWQIYLPKLSSCKLRVKKLVRPAFLIPSVKYWDWLPPVLIQPKVTPSVGLDLATQLNWISSSFSICITLHSGLSEMN